MIFFSIGYKIVKFKPYWKKWYWNTRRLTFTRVYQYSQTFCQSSKKIIKYKIYYSLYCHLVHHTAKHFHEAMKNYVLLLCNFQSLYYLGVLYQRAGLGFKAISSSSCEIKDFKHQWDQNTSLYRQLISFSYIRIFDP